MSRCISRHGEYSDHELSTTGPAAERFTCRLCGGLAEDELFAALDRAEATIARVRTWAESSAAAEASDDAGYDITRPVLAALDGTDGGGGEAVRRECGYVRTMWDGPYRMDDECTKEPGICERRGHHGPWRMLPPGEALRRIRGERDDTDGGES